MSKLNALALSGAFAIAAFASLPAEVAAQNRSGSTVTSPGPVRVTTGRPTVVERGPVRGADRGPDRDRGDHLQERLRNACFNTPNPPAPTCRRYFGEGTGSRPNG